MAKERGEAQGEIAVNGPPKDLPGSARSAFFASFPSLAEDPLKSRFSPFLAARAFASTAPRAASPFVSGADLCVCRLSLFIHHSWRVLFIPFLGHLFFLSKRTAFLFHAHYPSSSFLVRSLRYRRGSQRTVQLRCCVGMIKR